MIIVLRSLRNPHPNNMCFTHHQRHPEPATLSLPPFSPSHHSHRPSFLLTLYPPYRTTQQGGTTQLMRIPPSVLKLHNKKDDAWSAINGKVYNLTPYLPYHPGGERELMRVAGRDGTKLFGGSAFLWLCDVVMLRCCCVLCRGGNLELNCTDICFLFVGWWW